VPVDGPGWTVLAFTYADNPGFVRIIPRWRGRPLTAYEREHEITFEEARSHLEPWGKFFFITAPDSKGRRFVFVDFPDPEDRKSAQLHYRLHLQSKLRAEASGWHDLRQSSHRDWRGVRYRNRPRNIVV
jgi:hypothetical protein